VICLLPNCCFLAETSRMLEIYRALRGRGAPVRVATHGGTQERELHAAGVPYDVVGARVTRERCREFVRSVPGIGPPDQSMRTDEELRAYADAQAVYWTPRRPASYRPGTRLRYVGPIYAKLAVPMPERVERFLAGARPLVYVAITSSPPSSCATSSARPERSTCRSSWRPRSTIFASSRTRACSSTACCPATRSCPRVDLAVTAGGQGSVQTALASGVPLLGIPLQPEQDANVALAERQGAARLVAQRDAAACRGTAR
jgi:hypothetical protein